MSDEKKNKLWYGCAVVRVPLYVRSPEQPTSEEMADFAEEELRNRIRPFDGIQVSEVADRNHKPRGGWDLDALVWGPNEDVTLRSCLEDIDE